MKKDDSLWKGILEDVFPHFLRFFFPNAHDLFDFKKGFVFLDKELNELFPAPEKPPGQRFVDKLVQVFLKDGKKQWLLIHIEVQNAISSGFPERMYEYQYRIRDRYKMPVVAFAISSGTRLKPIPDQYNYALLGTSIRYQYNTFQIATQDDKILSQSNNPFAMVVLIAKKAAAKGQFTDDYLLTQNTELAKLLFSKDFPPKTIRSVMNFLRHYVHFENKDYYANFDKEVASLTSNKKTMGIEELLLKNAEERGEKRGEKRAEKRAERQLRKVVANLIKDTDFDDKKIAALAGTTVTFVAQVREELNK